MMFLIFKSLKTKKFFIKKKISFILNFILNKFKKNKISLVFCYFSKKIRLIFIIFYFINVFKFIRILYSLKFIFIKKLLKKSYIIKRKIN